MSDPVDLANFESHVEQIFASALKLTGPGRAALLDVSCAGHPDLRAEVESLLTAYDRSTGFIQPVTLTPPNVAAGAVPGGAGIGDRVGAFRLVEVLGEGGMGTVFRAERADGERSQRVAIKFIGSWIRDPATVGRFRTERQILASLQHPNIVSLIDGGATSDGAAYLVMEYVDGQPITTYCRERRLSLESRLRVFSQVCAAVQFVHAHRIVHRDLKPANILVTGDGVPKVLDFGVAKLLEPASANATSTGRFPGPLTPNYASPEQLRGLPVTTASDLYALGVLLYELVTGSRPYDTAGKPADEVLSLVLETDPPVPSVSASSLSGDLDAIVLKALQKEPERRYASAADLADDITRYLEGRAVLARPVRTTRAQRASNERFYPVLTPCLSEGQVFYRPIARKGCVAVKNRLASIKWIPLTLASAAAAIVCVLVYAGPAMAGIDNSPFNTGMVGITDSQTARLNAVNVGRGRATVELEFLDGYGRTVAESVHVLDTGRSASLMLPATAGALLPAVRTYVKMRGAGIVISTLEIVDRATGKTDLIVTNSSAIAFASP